MVMFAQRAQRAQRAQLRQTQGLRVSQQRLCLPARGCTYFGLKDEAARTVLLLAALFVYPQKEVVFGVFGFYSPVQGLSYWR